MNMKQVILSLFGIITLTAVTAQGAGTLTPASTGQLPADILSHDVRVTINNGFARTEVTQQFKNPNDAVMEAMYSFPVPQSASLSECQVLTGETVLNGEVVAKDKAHQIYEEEKNAGGNAAVADKNGYQNFSFSIANIQPQDTVQITFVYYQPLSVDTNVCRYVYPLQEGNTDDSAAEAFWTRNDKPTGQTTVHVELRSAWPVAGIRAPYGTVTTQTADLPNGEADLVYELPEGLAKDFVFYYNLEENLPGRLEVIPYKQADKTGTFMMVLTPGVDLQPITNGSDYIFVLDVSGSMTGDKIDALVDGVTKTIRKMNPQDRFRVILFESSAHDLTHGYLNATPENVETAAKAISGIHACGSTNLFDGLTMALSKLDADRVSSIILVTDGVANTGEVAPKRFASLFKDKDIRVFGFLMGNSANWPLMRTICDASGGFYDAVSNSDDIIGKILLAKSKITSEAMHDVQLSISGVQTKDLTKNCVKKLFRGQQLVLFGRYDKGGRATVTMKTKISGETKTYSCELELPQEDLDNPELERLWALAQIEMHEDMVNQGMEEAKEQQDLTRSLGIAYQLVTDETSMIVLDDSAHAKHGIERRNQERVKAERKAQSAKLAAPVKSYRADANNRHDNGMFTVRAPSIGGGAMDPIALLIFGCTAFVTLCISGSKRDDK